MHKCPVYGLPWSRRQVANGYEVTGPAVTSVIPPTVLQTAKQVAVVDDIFDTGATITALLRCLYQLHIMLPQEICCYAPFSKNCFNTEGVVHYEVGKEIDTSVWVRFFWESGSVALP